MACNRIGTTVHVYGVNVKRLVIGLAPNEITVGLLVVNEVTDVEFGVVGEEVAALLTPVQGVNFIEKS